jgi:hypothetical protein
MATTKQVQEANKRLDSKRRKESPAYTVGNEGKTKPAPKQGPRAK